MIVTNHNTLKSKSASPYWFNKQINRGERKILPYNKIPTNTCRRNKKNREI